MNADDALARHGRLVQALLRGDALDAPVADRSLVQTHISSLVLAGTYAYKLRKPLKLDILDFSTPELRHADCLEELRLNRRTAPQLYLNVLPITGSPEAPRLGAPGDAPQAIDWVLRMRRFEQAQLLDAMAHAGTLTEAHIDALAQQVAAFHGALPAAPREYGQPAEVRRWVLANLEAMRASAAAPPHAARIDGLQAWTERECDRLAPLLARRHAQGFVREGHGDLHLGNIVLVDGAPLPFDGIEFNAALRHIDVVNDIAFTFMDLLRHDLRALAWRFVSDYAERSGDYAGLVMLRFYAVYRALVRARVALLRVEQSDAQARAAFERDLVLAERIAAPPPAPLLVLVCGLSGSGKSTAAQWLAQAIDAVRVRSDVERKRLYGLAADARPTPAEAATLYGAEATQRTYAQLGTLARELLQGSVATVVDAVALHRPERDALRALAAELGARFVLLECRAPESVLRERLLRRRRDSRDASDADSAVLDLQLRAAAAHPVAPPEQALALDTDCDLATLAQRCASLAAQLSGARAPANDETRP